MNYAARMLPSQTASLRSLRASGWLAKLGWSLLVATLMVVAASRVAWSAEGGTISGLVRDPSGAVVPGAEVTARNTQTGLNYAVKTDAQGFYAVLSLPVGHYEVLVHASGFKEYRQTDLVIDFNTALRVDVMLQVGAETQRVTVSSTALHVDTTSTQMGEVIGSTKMSTLPLNGRAYTDLLALQTGVVPVSSGQYGPAAVSGELNPGGLSVNGMREASNSFVVNGGLVEEDMNNGTAIIPNLESIAEFRILTNNFDAEYGNFNGGQVNVVTKSGTNQFHGDAFEFLRNSNMDSRNFFSPTRGSLHRNQFGGTGGGPIRRDKIFFFGDYQGTREVVGVDTGDIPVPSLADRQGNLSDIASSLTGTVNGAFWANTLAQELGYPVTAGEAYYTSGCTSSSQCVFPNATIPQSAWASPSPHLLPFIPLPNVPGGFFSTSKYKETLRDNKASGRLDANTRWGELSGYYFVDDYSLVNPYSSSNVPGFSADTIGRAQLLSLNDTKSLGASAVNEFHFSYMRDANYFSKPVGGVGPKLSSLGFVEGANTLGMVPDFPELEGVPPVSLNNFTIGMNAYSGPQQNNTFQARDNYSKVVGTHTIKFGGDYHYDAVRTRSSGGVREGSFGFYGSETGSDFADFLIGAPSNFNHGGIWDYENRGRFYGAFAQDSWRATSNLTLNYGLHWEVATPWWEKHNQGQALKLGCQSQSFPGAPKGWCFVGDDGIPTTLAPTRYDNFAPRIGLAYAPGSQGGVLGRLFGGPGKTSIRAAFGIFHTTLEENANSGAVGDAPFTIFWVSPVPPLFATPFVDRATGHSEGQRYPVPPIPSNWSPQHPDNNINWAQFLPISSSPVTALNNHVPYAEHYSFSLQRQFGSNTMLSLNYVGTQGHKLLANVDSNPGIPALCLSLSQPSQVAPGSATCGPFGEGGVYTTASGQVINSTRGPFGADFGGDNPFISTLANSNYNSFQASLRHTSGRMEFLLGYTYSKSLDDSSGAVSGGFNDWVNSNYNSKATKALSAFDVTNNFVLSYSYEMPFDKLFRTSRDRLARGWVITGITRFATGLPVGLAESDDNSLLGNGVLDVPNFTPGPLKKTDPRSRLPYFNTSLFAPEPLGQLGTASRFFFHGPGLNNWDLAMHKDIRLTESKTLELRGEFFNVGNHAQFGSPIGNINNSAFGLVTGAGAARIGQVAAKFLF